MYHPDCASCHSNPGLSPLATSKQPHSGASFGLVSQSSENSSGLVTDILDLDDANLESLGACGGVTISDDVPKIATVNQEDLIEDESQLMDDFRVEGRILQKMLNMDIIEQSSSDVATGGGSGGGVGCGFGPIKDISVSNIHIDENDKMKHFTEKDFSNLTKTSKPKVVERGNGRLFAANTPGDDEKVFTLLSPESDFSESSSSEVWGFRPQLVHEPVQTHTPETDSSMDGCSYADLPNQNCYYRHDDTLSEESPVMIGGETKLMNLNLIGHSGQASANQISLNEMTENLLKMTLDMQKELEIEEATQFSAQPSDDLCVVDLESDVISKNSSDPQVPPSGEVDEPRRVFCAQEQELSPLVEQELPPPLTLDVDSSNEHVDVESADAFMEDEAIMMSETVGETSGDTTTLETREDTETDTVEKSPTESRSTFV